MAVGGGSVGVLWVNLVTNTGTRGMVCGPTAFVETNKAPVCVPGGISEKMIFRTESLGQKGVTAAYLS